MNDPAASRRGIRQKLLFKSRSKLRGMKPTGGNQTMYSYLRGIEQIAQMNPDRTIYNLSSHGACMDHVNTLESITELIHL